VKPSIHVLDFANTRAVGAWACRNEGGKAQFCKTEHLCAQFRKHEGGGCVGESKKARFCETEHLCARFRKHEGSGCVGESEKAQFCETEHPCAQFRKHEGGGCMGESKELGFQNRAPMCSISQTQVLGLAETRVERLSFAKPSTKVLNLAKPRAEGT